MKGMVNLLIVVLVLLGVIVGSWNIHLVASVNGIPYASTQEFLSFIGIVADGILGLTLWLINRGEEKT